MLTSDLVRVRRREGKIHPTYLRGDARARLLPLATSMESTMAAMTGRTRDEIDDALDAIEVGARDRLVGVGLRKLLEDRSEFEVATEADPEALRREVFLEAAAQHRALGVRDEFDKEAVLVSVAARIGSSPEAIEAGLYADLRGSEVLQRFRRIDPEALLDRYNVALAQAALLRAAKVTVQLEGESPARYRDLFRAVRFHGLLHVVRGDRERGYTLILDGPFSLFGAVQRYGLKLALFLPSLLHCRSWSLRADVLWGKAREPMIFELDDKDGLASEPPDAARLSPELEAFCGAFRKLDSAWSVAANEHIFALPGEVVCVPDLVFTSAKTGEEVFLEAFGFWSRAAVWQRVELLRKGFPARILLAVGKQLRVSEEVLGEDDAGEIYVYRATISPRAVLERLERRK